MPAGIVSICDLVRCAETIMDRNSENLLLHISGAVSEFSYRLTHSLFGALCTLNSW
jgi:hypothetical protein